MVNGKVNGFKTKLSNEVKKQQITFKFLFGKEL